MSPQRRTPAQTAVLVGAVLLIPVGLIGMVVMLGIALSGITWEPANDSGPESDADRDDGAELEIGSGDGCAASDEPIVRAAEAGDVDEVRAQLDEGVNPDLQDDARNSPLACAGPSGHLDVVQLLLERGGNPDSVARDGDPVLKDAVVFCKPELVEMLLSAGADPDPVGSPTPLESAVEAISPAMVGQLLDAGAKLPTPTSTEPEPFDFVNEDRNNDPRAGCPVPTTVDADAVVDLLLTADNGEDAALHIAVTLGSHAAVVSTLAHQPSEPAVQAALALTVSSGRAEDTGLLIDAGADPSSPETLGLETLLLSFGACARNAPTTGAQCGSVVSLYAEFPPGTSIPPGSSVSPDLSTIEATPLLRAASSGDLPTVVVLLDAGADPNVVSSRGFTPLHGAAAACDAEVIHALLDAGVTIPLAAEWGAATDPPLPSEIARAKGCPDIADLFAAFEAPPPTTN